MYDCGPRRKRYRISGGGCPPGGPGPLLRSYANIIRDFENRYRRKAARDIRFYAKQKTLAEVVRLATLAQTAEGKRQSHQRRIPAPTLQRAYAKLKLCDFKACRSFHQLHQMVNDAIRSIRGIGELAVYDIAHRIGAHLGRKPKKVYLHCGTRVGARAMGLGRGVDTLEVDELPVAFRQDFLCIYKEDLKHVNGRQ
jgi:hypothetical protein